MCHCNDNLALRPEVAKENHRGHRNQTSFSIVLLGKCPNFVSVFYDANSTGFFPAFWCFHFSVFCHFRYKSQQFNSNFSIVFFFDEETMSKR